MALFLAWLLVFAGQAEAFYIDGVGGASYPTSCSTCQAGTNPGACAKSEPGNCPSCGSSSDDCCVGISEWQKYRASCRLVNSEFEQCDWVWVYDTQICSTADTCRGGIGLYPGYCDCSSGSDLYKTCCADDGSGPVSCTGGDHSGVCPAGSHSVRCGDTGEPCGV